MENLDEDKIKELYLEKGKSTIKIAQIMNTNQNSINRRLKQMGVEIKSRKEYGWESYKAKLNEEKIKDLYINERKSATEIGKIFGVSSHTIINRLKKLGIKIRESSEQRKLKLDLNNNIIKDLYLNQRKSITEIGELFGVHHSTIFNRLKEEGIKMRGLRKDIDTEEIIDLYINKNKSSIEISKIVNLSVYAILRRLRERGVDRRSLSEALKGHKAPKNAFKKNQSWEERWGKEKADEVKKAYSKRLSENSPTKYLWKDPIYREKQIRLILNGLAKRPTSYEKKIADLCIENSLPFIYTGDGRFLINFKNPDLVNEKDRIVIEVFYSYFKIRDYGSVEKYKEFCREKYNSAGWKVIFIDENEVDVKNWKELCLNKIQIGLR